jgi:Family of unknown function (DUF6528)
MSRLHLALVISLLSAAPSSAFAQSLLVCGWDEVFVLDVSGSPRKVWSWKAAERPELPEPYRTKFRTTDECKSVDGNRVLITASSDGAALVDRTTGRTLWWGECGNTHSAELLPGDRIVLACSVREGTGNRLALFDAREPARELFTTELFSGHGAVWDASRSLLWALGEKELRAYRLTDWETLRPGLALDARYPLPDVGGHELGTVPDSPHLIVSTHAGVWRFDRDSHKFTPDPDLGGVSDVKSAVIDPVTGRLAYTQAERPEWWTSHIRFRHPDGDVHLAGERLYKVRWIR